MASGRVDREDRGAAGAVVAADRSSNPPSQPKTKRATCVRQVARSSFWLRGGDLNPRPLGYEPNELPDCSTPRQESFESFGSFEPFEPFELFGSFEPFGSFGSFEPFGSFGSFRGSNRSDRCAVRTCERIARPDQFERPERFNVARDSAGVKGRSRPNVETACPNAQRRRAMTHYRWGWLAAVLILLTASARLGAQEIPADFVITLERTFQSCGAECPTYSVSIDAQGNVTYQGKMYVRVTGQASDRIPLSHVRTLLEAVERLGFFKLQDRYRRIRNPDGTEAFVTHRQTSFLTVTLNGESKRIEEQFGAPVGLMELVQVPPEYRSSRFVEDFDGVIAALQQAIAKKPR